VVAGDAGAGPGGGEGHVDESQAAVRPCQLPAPTGCARLRGHGRNKTGRELDMLTGATIRRYRELRGMTQGELARRLRISRQAVCGGESGAVQEPQWLRAAADILFIPDETWMNREEMLIKIAQLSDQLLCLETEGRQVPPSGYGAYGTGRPTARTA
jgi:DNA-binding XRE family transcriptional regulator